jgi:putative tryptophan/tyrosine transport system ATP-binding protein
MLHLKNISVSFGATQVLKNLNAQVDKGDFIVIVGTNGAGKSTFFDVIAGKVQPQEGSVFLDNIDITQKNELKRASYITRLFQNTHLNCVGSMTVLQNLAMATYSRRNARLINGLHDLDESEAIRLLSPLNIDTKSILHRPMNALSGGQRQLISFIMATRIPPKILLLDEPTAALDPQASTKLLQFVCRYIKEHNITALLITHDPHIALTMGNKVWVLDEGKITKQYEGDEKKSLNPDSLVGQIDYASLSSC